MASLKGNRGGNSHVLLSQPVWPFFKGRPLSQDDASPILNTVTSTFLLEGLRDAGNRTIWQEFVDRYRPMLVRYGVRGGLRESDAQDAAQQTLIAFCNAYQAGQYQREQGRLRHWLFGIARNQIRNTFRRVRRKEIQVAGEASRTDFFDRQVDHAEMERIWEDEWQQAVLRQCLEEIRREVDAKSIQAFELFAWKGQSALEVAELLGMTPNAVFITKHRSMKRIRALLPQMEDVC